jgi:hypothetical protein
MTRKPYHRDPARNRTSARRARNPRDAARRLALRCALLRDGQRATLVRAGAVWLLITTDGAWRLDLRLQDFTDAPDAWTARQWVRRNLPSLRRGGYQRLRCVQDWMDEEGVWVDRDVVRAACHGLHRLADLEAA